MAIAIETLTSLVTGQKKTIRKPVYRSIPQPAAKPERLQLTPAKLAEVEERLLASAIEAHPGRERAISHLLSDVERPAAMDTTARRVLPAGDVKQNETIEDLLFAAIVQAHHNRDGGLDRLLADVVADAAADDTLDDEAELLDMLIDNDFDGLS